MARKKRRGMRRGLSGISMAALRAELERRQHELPLLLKRHERAQAELESLAERIRAIGGEAGGGAQLNGRRAGRVGGRVAGRAVVRVGGRVRGRGAPGRKRPSNAMSLVEALSRLLQGRTMSVTNAAEAVQKEGGYKTSSDNFRTIVNQTLIKSDRFKKVSRGQYTAK